MTDCPNCEYHRQRTQLWREEAYKQAGHPLPEQDWVERERAVGYREGHRAALAQRTWVGLTKEERHEISMANRPYCADIMAAHEEELKRRNT